MSKVARDITTEATNCSEISSLKYPSTLAKSVKYVGEGIVSRFNESL